MRSAAARRDFPLYDTLEIRFYRHVSSFILKVARLLDLLVSGKCNDHSDNSGLRIERRSFEVALCGCLLNAVFMNIGSSRSVTSEIN